jgi:hypothetical protein
MPLGTNVLHDAGNVPEFFISASSAHAASTWNKENNRNAENTVAR